MENTKLQQSIIELQEALNTYKRHLDLKQETLNDLKEYYNGKRESVKTR